MIYKLILIQSHITNHIRHRCYIYGKKEGIEYNVKNKSTANKFPTILNNFT